MSYLTFQIERHRNDPYDFTADVMPVNQQEDEDAITEEQLAKAWSEFQYQMKFLNAEDHG